MLLVMNIAPNGHQLVLPTPKEKFCHFFVRNGSSLLFKKSAQWEPQTSSHWLSLCVCVCVCVCAWIHSNSLPTSGKPLYLLFKAPTCFCHISWLSSGSYKFGRHVQRVRDNSQAIYIYRFIHKSLRDFRPLRYSIRDSHAEGEHVNRGRDTPSFCPTLQVLDMLTSEGSWQTFLAHARQSRPMAPAGLFVSQRTGSHSAGISCTTHELFCP